MTNARYQVFVSSTYTDLVEERREVSEQLQRLRCIPAGMELFTASGRPPWDLIQSSIDDSDYVVLILAGRYGSSTGDDGLSYTEKEYDYALSRGIPILAFLHRDLGSLPSRNVDAQETSIDKREAFWGKVRDGERHTVGFWKNASDLAQQVLTAVSAAINDQSRPGWVRGTGEASGGRPVSLAGGVQQASDLTRADNVREALIPPGGAARVERAIGDAVRRVQGLPFIKGAANYNGGPVQTVHAERVAALEDAARPLLQTIAAAARWGAELDGYWIDVIRATSSSLRLSGYAALVELVRAPAALMLTAVGIGACAGRRDDLLGLLLSEQFELDNPDREEDAPAVALLHPTLMYPDDWASKRLWIYIESVLGEDEAWKGKVLDRAWERWEYLAGVARTFYATKLNTSFGAMPYLRIEERVQTGIRPVVAKVVRKDVTSRGNNHPLLSKGLCDGSADDFDAAADSFDSRYGRWGDNQDSRALPRQGGAMHTGPHYPGDRSDIAV